MTSCALRPNNSTSGWRSWDSRPEFLRFQSSRSLAMWQFWQSPHGPLHPCLSPFRPHPTCFCSLCCKRSYLAEIDPWVTQVFPLGHPEFSTASPRVFHWVTQACPGPAAKCHVRQRGARARRASRNYFTRQNRKLGLWLAVHTDCQRTFSSAAWAAD